MNQIVDEYLDHFLSSFGRLEKLKSLMESNSGSYCFMPDQQNTLDRMGQNIQKSLKLFYFARNVFVPTDTQTFLVEDAEDFCHLVRCFIISIIWHRLF